MAKRANKKEPRVSYSKDLTVKICLEIACGASVKNAAEANGITERAFFIWLTKYPSLVQDYARARELRADAHFESSSNLMEDLRSGKVDASQARVLLDEIKWKCGKENAKKYGEKVDFNHGGQGAENPINMAVTVSAEESYRRMLGGK